MRGVPNYRRAARQAARRYGLDPGVFTRQIQQESGFNPNAVSPKGATGIAQIIPDTARAWGIDPNNPSQALDAAARNMAEYVRKYGGYENALRAYNAGPARIQASHGYAETNAYVKNILGGSDPRTLNTPKGGQAGGTSRPGPAIPFSVSATGQGQATTQVDTGGNTAALEALAQSLTSQQAPPMQASLPVPAFAARPVLPAGYQAPQVSGQPQQGVDVASVLASLNQASGSSSMPVTQHATGQSSLSGVTRGPSVSDVNGGGRLLVVGDSLAVGTSPFFKHAKTNAKVGRTSTASVRDAQGELSSGKFGRVLLDFGTNDSSPQELVRSVKRAQRLAPNAEILVPEIRGGRDAAAKTAALSKLPGIHLLPWRTPLGPDGVHPGDYQARYKEIGPYVRPKGAPAGSPGFEAHNLSQGRVNVPSGVNRPGTALHRPLVGFLEAAAGVLGKPINVSTGTNHSQFVQGRPGVQSEHWDGWAVDLGSVANKFEIGGEGGTRIATSALVAAGVPERRARSMAEKGGIFNIPQPGGGRVQVIWRAEGHFDHVHVGYRPGSR